MTITSMVVIGAWWRVRTKYSKQPYVIIVADAPPTVSIGTPTVGSGYLIIYYSPGI